MANSSSSGPVAVILIAGLVALGMATGVIFFLGASDDSAPAKVEAHAPAVVEAIESPPPAALAPPVAEPVIIEAPRPAPQPALDGGDEPRSEATAITLNSSVRPGSDGSDAPVAPATTGTLDKAVILRVIRARTNAIRKCYADELQLDPELAGGVTVRFVISEAGVVTESQVSSSDFGDAKIGACLLKEVDSMRFPRPEGGSVTVSYPFKFAPG